MGFLILTSRLCRPLPCHPLLLIDNTITNILYYYNGKVFNIYWYIVYLKKRVERQKRRKGRQNKSFLYLKKKKLVNLFFIYKILSGRGLFRPLPCHPLLLIDNTITNILYYYNGKVFNIYWYIVYLKKRVERQKRRKGRQNKSFLYLKKKKLVNLFFIYKILSGRGLFRPLPSHPKIKWVHNWF